MGERIAKVVARAGLCSRREAEAWIAAGRVRVNGAVLGTPACVVGPGDAVEVDGRPLPAAGPPRIWRHHKPAGLVTTRADERGRRTVFDALPPGLPRVVSVGRLDRATEGLLLLTNDGGLARTLELPASGWERTYRAQVEGRPGRSALRALEGGVTVAGTRYRPMRVRPGREGWITVTLAEGKKREVRRALEHVGHPVARLIRVAYGPFVLGDLEPGAVAEADIPAALRAVVQM